MKASRSRVSGSATWSGSMGPLYSGRPAQLRAMFSADVQVHDFTAQDWLRLPLLFRQAQPSATAAAGGIFAVRDGDRIVKVASTLRGRLPPPAAGHASAQQLGEEHGVSFALVLSTIALEQLGDRFARRMSRGQSFHA